MTTCEDAPCCGCCGTNIYGVYQGEGGSGYWDEPDWWMDWEEKRYWEAEAEAEAEIERWVEEGTCCERGDWIGQGNGTWTCDLCGERIAWEATMAAFAYQRGQRAVRWAGRLEKYRQRAIRRGTLVRGR